MLRRKFILSTAIASAAILASCQSSSIRAVSSTKESTMRLTQEWDKTFPKSDKVDHQKVTFTGVGCGFSSVTSSASSPWTFDPQHWTVPSSRSAQTARLLVAT